MSDIANASTPIRVRGKRKGTDAEKGLVTVRKRRNKRFDPPTDILRSNSCPRGSSKHRLRRRDLAMIEQLPVEIIQAIFEISMNIDLPAASPILATQLAHAHLYNRMMDLVMYPLLARFEWVEGKWQAVTSASLSEVRHASRLLNSRFCTWPFFQHWLHLKVQSFDGHPALKSDWHVDGLKYYQQKCWDRQHLRVADDILQYHTVIFYPLAPIPTKLRVRPFSQDKIDFLTVLYCDMHMIYKSARRLTEEDFYDAFKEAIADNCVEVLRLLIEHEVRAENVTLLRLLGDLLLVAVKDFGCFRPTVRELLPCVELDAPDFQAQYQEIWIWAEHARAHGDENGQWVINLLKDSHFREHETKDSFFRGRTSRTVTAA